MCAASFQGEMYLITVIHVQYRYLPSNLTNLNPTKIFTHLNVYMYSVSETQIQVVEKFQSKLKIQCVIDL